ncbi:MAG: tryptophan-rich sensory protein [Hyphomicrobium sp.]|nr:tryptophan-rich sensory protein [Hyphomicrobium sp.]
MSKMWSLAAFVALVFIAAGSGAVFQTGPWYEALNKPSWTPPNWLFPVAWTVLYVMIAIAGWLVWKAGGGFSAAIAIWGVGLVLNALWSYIMFGRHDISLALVDVTGLWLATAAFIVAAWGLDHRAAYLFMPYLVWVTFAAALNFEVWRLNP